MDYSHLNLNSRMQKVGSLPERVKFTDSVSFESLFEPRSKSLRASSFVQNSGVGTASGSFDTATSVTITARYTNENQGGLRTFGIPFIAVYTGTTAVANNQIYPRFGTIANDLYSIHSGFDYRGWNGVDTVFRINIENNSGTTSSIYAEVQWKKAKIGRAHV